jgi:hypothetical protein
MWRATILMMSLAACSSGTHGVTAHAVVGGTPGSGKAFTWWSYTSTDKTNATVHPQLDGKRVVLTEGGGSTWDAEILGDSLTGFQLDAGTYTLALDISKQPTSVTIAPDQVYWVTFYGDSSDPQLKLWTDDQQPPVSDTFHMHIFNMGPDKQPLDVLYQSGTNPPVALAAGLAYGAGVDVDVVAAGVWNLSFSSPALALKYPSGFPLAPLDSYSANVGFFGYRDKPTGGLEEFLVEFPYAPITK